MTIEPGLSARYEIRTLGPEHADWANAIVCHSNTFASPIWSVIFPEDQTARCHRMFEESAYMVRHQIDSGLSLGVFDTAYQFRRPQSAATDGKLYWDERETATDREALAEQMDFPLVSVALSYDAFYPPPPVELAGLIDVLPPFIYVYKFLAERDPRDAKTWQATGPSQVLMRNATSTKEGEEGRGFMALLARYLMRNSAAAGFRGIQIDCVHDAVNHVWSKPPAPFKGEVVSKFNCFTAEEEDDSEEEVTYPFRPATQDITRVYVTLK